MCLQRVIICSYCGKNADGLMRCIPLVGNELHLCPDCLEKDGQYCFRCGHFNDNLVDGYCEECADEIEYEIAEWCEDRPDDDYLDDLSDD